MLASLSENSLKQYDVSLKRWFKFCTENGSDLYEASVPTVIYFLTQQFNSGCQYGTLNSCRGALALILGSHISVDDRVKRFFKGIYRLCPPLPKYNMTWDTSKVLEALSLWYPNESLTLTKLSKKCVTLLALTTAHRVQTLAKINIKNIESVSSRISIKIPDLIKTSKARTNQPILYLPYYTEKPEICPVKTLIAYLNKTESLRKNDTLFITFKKPHDTATTQTLSRWIKSTLNDCGIDASVFTAHSTRHAATSRAHQMGVNIDIIRRTAGWSGTSKTFGRFYHRTIVNDDPTALARAVLNND